MDIKQLNEDFSVSPQTAASDVEAIASLGFRSIVCNRPDGEAGDQPLYEEIRERAASQGLQCAYLPVESGKVSDENAEDFSEALRTLPAPVLAFCRTGTRSVTLWSLASAQHMELPVVLASAKAAGFDMSGVARRIVNRGRIPTEAMDGSFDVVVLGAGAAGIAVASSLRRRSPDPEIALIDPADIHYIVHDLLGRTNVAHYDGYGSCPLTVERGKIVLAEFGYGGRLLPSFPGWLVNGTRPSRLAWLLKEKVLPPLYWKGMLKGREWLARPEMVD